MRRSAVIVVMLFALLWQAVASARAGSSINAFADLAHAALHWQDAAHHHHDDGSYHQDDSSESTHHVLIDHAGTAAALLNGAAHEFPATASSAPGSLRAASIPDPALEGLLRPPRPRA